MLRDITRYRCPGITHIGFRGLWPQLQERAFVELDETIPRRIDEHPDRIRPDLINPTHETVS